MTLQEGEPVQKGESSLFKGAVYALATAGLLATQAPLSLLGAKHLSIAEFIGVTELVLVLCVPFMLRTQRSREDFRALIWSVSNLGKFGVLLLIGLAGIVLFCRPQSRPFLGGDHCLPHRGQENSDLPFDLHTMPRRGVRRRDASRDKPVWRPFPFVGDL
jgi:hypothetical protein